MQWFNDKSHPFWRVSSNERHTFFPSPSSYGLLFREMKYVKQNTNNNHIIWMLKAKRTHTHTQTVWLQSPNAVQLKICVGHFSTASQHFQRTETITRKGWEMKRQFMRCSIKMLVPQAFNIHSHSHIEYSWMLVLLLLGSDRFFPLPVRYAVRENMSNTNRILIQLLFSPNNSKYQKCT